MKPISLKNIGAVGRPTPHLISTAKQLSIMWKRLLGTHSSTRTIRWQTPAAIGEMSEFRRHDLAHPAFHSRAVISPLLAISPAPAPQQRWPSRVGEGSSSTSARLTAALYVKCSFTSMFLWYNSKSPLHSATLFLMVSI